MVDRDPLRDIDPGVHPACCGGVAVTVIVPYIRGMLEDATREWAEASGARLNPLYDDPSAYWELLASEWRYGEIDAPLVVVEHDVLPARGVVEAMQACPRPWCASPYQLGTGVWLDEGLGCTKFSAKLITDHPDLMEVVGRIDNDGMPARDWHRLDVRIARTLRDLGYAPHRHRRSTHLHDYSKRP